MGRVCSTDKDMNTYIGFGEKTRRKQTARETQTQVGG
jgi:hypothetical protein